MKLNNFVRAVAPNQLHAYLFCYLKRGTSVAAAELAGLRVLPQQRVPGTHWWRFPMAKEDRGFASMDRTKQREIASKGGRAAHVKGTAHEWSAEEARVAGRKGGQISRGGRGRLGETSAIDGSPEPTEPSGAFGARQD